MGYYIVTAKCGHVGRDRFIPIAFAVMAASGAEAAALTRTMPRVKHHHRDAILSVEKTDWFAYAEQRFINSFDPYLLCGNKREQRQEAEAIDHRVETEPVEEKRRMKTVSEKAVYDGKRRIRNVRRYAREQKFSFNSAEAI